jgi:two-component system sensor histidine kinase QseC
LLVVATEREPHDRLERSIHYTLMTGVALALVLAVLIALLAVRRGLAPLQRFGARIAELDGSQPPSPLAAEPLPRELEPFSRALGSALDRLYATIEGERRFSRDIAHELRTPLAEIRTSIEAAARTPTTPMRPGLRSAPPSERSNACSARSTLLMLARQEAGLARAAVDPLDLPPLLEALADALGALMRGRGLRLAREIPAHLWVRSDVGALERIVSNLMRNAIEYSPSGSTVTMTLETSDSGTTLRIANPAPELRDDDLPRLGQRFWRKSPSGGTAAHAGLGLALSLALARGLSLELAFTLEDGQLAVRLGPIPLL